MTFYTEEADMPWVELPQGFYLALEAIDPTTGSAVTGVTVSQVALYGDILDGEEGLAVSSGPFMLVPGPGTVGNPGDGADIRGGQ